MIAEYARKLCYRNLNENKIGRLGRAYQNRIFDLTISPERIIRKLKSEEYGFHYKDILKVPHPSRTIPCFATGSPLSKVVQRLPFHFTEANA